MVKTKFTQVEKETILTLLEKNIEEGWYYGNKEQYFKRLQKIKEKLEELERV